ncbi:MAG: hypothetical protein K8S54_19975 [Spirochaetia bacterium]|nr:hypothetical protein [Spirochaetia bacterium]
MRIVFLLTLVVSCSSRPGWVHSAPEQTALAAGAVPVNLAGVWRRDAQNRFPIAHKTAYSDSNEWIEITANGTYSKVQMYAEVVDGKEEFIAYRETGTISENAEWLLFNPERTESFETKGPVRNPSTGIDPHYPFPQVSSIPFRQRSNPEPLLFFLEKGKHEDLLIPSAYERLGVTFNFGLYEGSRREFDSRSRNFDNNKQTVVNRRFQPAHYRRLIHR